MGSRLFSNTTNLLGGHDFTNDDHRSKVADILEIDSEQIPREPSWAYHEIIEGILRGKIKGLWVICTNPAHSWINQTQCRDILERLDFLVVQDMYHTTETARMADLVLPAAGWGEKEGTIINSERRIGVLKKVCKAPGEALSDFSIFRLIAEYWGVENMFKKWSSPEAVFQILKQLSEGQPCDITGVEDYRMLDEMGGIQWPFGPGRRSSGQRRGTEDKGFHPSPLDPQPSSERRLFEDGRFYHIDGRAKFLFEDPRPMPEPPSDQFPFVLLTGRGTASQWHTQTRTSKSAVLKKLYPANLYVEINPGDARKRGIKPQDNVVVMSQRGQVTASAFVTPSVQPGQLFLPMHYEEVNQLTDAVFDPYSKQPSYKACAVQVHCQ
jgi:anaerobic selenocysteine-containing dehydrogenase